MKPVLPLVCALLGFVGGLAANYMIGPKSHDERTLADDQDVQTNLATATRDVRSLREDLDEMRAKNGGLEAELVALRQAFKDGPFGAELDSIREDLNALKLAQGGDARPAALKLRLKDGDEEKLVDVDEYIEARINRANSEQRKQQQRRQFSQAKPFIKMGMNRQVEQYKKKLNLNEEQTTRLTQSFNDAFDKTFPSMEIIMDPEKPLAEKQAAAKDVTTTLDQVNSDARTYLDSGQYEQFTEQQQQNNAGLQAMINAGLNGGGMPFPFGGPGGGGNQGGQGTQGQN